MANRKKPARRFGTIPESKLASEYAKRRDIREGESERWTWPKRRAQEQPA